MMDDIIKSAITTAAETASYSTMRHVAVMMLAASPHYKGKDGEFALKNFSETLMKKVNETSGD